jgi:hypothetical protein
MAVGSAVHGCQITVQCCGCDVGLSSICISCIPYERKKKCSFLHLKKDFFAKILLCIFSRIAREKKKYR